MSLDSLITLIHISDLHIGRMTAADEARLEPFPLWFGGKAGHEPRAAMALLEFFRNDPIAQGARLIFTGDLTAFGERDQFKEGETLLGELVDAGRQQAGVLIAGNHDFWQGCYGMFPPTQPWFLRERNREPDRIFGYQNYVRDLGTIGHGFSLRLVVLNSDSEVWGDDKQDGLRRFFAQGAFVREIERADEALAKNPAPPKTLTVLLMHHSPLYRSSNPLGRCEVDRFTAAFLRYFLTKHGISMVLTGHIHDHALLADLAQRIEFSGTRCSECRCGTTTQRRPRRENVDSPSWRKPVADSLHPRIAWLFGGEPGGGQSQAGQERSPGNVLLVHIIFYKMDSDEVFWATELHLFDGANFRAPTEPHGTDEDPLHWRKGNGAAVPPRFKRCVRIWPRAEASGPA